MIFDRAARRSNLRAYVRATAAVTCATLIACAVEEPTSADLGNDRSDPIAVDIRDSASCAGCLEALSIELGDDGTSIRLHASASVPLTARWHESDVDPGIDERGEQVFTLPIAPETLSHARLVPTPVKAAVSSAAEHGPVHAALSACLDLTGDAPALLSGDECSTALAAQPGAAEAVRSLSNTLNALGDPNAPRREVRLVQTVVAPEPIANDEHVEDNGDRHGH